ncbi:MAG: hypothetical protein H8E38_07210 [SAR324 cluster bacterium]|nr:hypothetical protein [SAR324 cluster bacterium]
MDYNFHQVLIKDDLAANHSKSTLSLKCFRDHDFIKLGSCLKGKRVIGEPLTFRSALVPPYVRKTRSLEATLPWLYLKGVSTENPIFVPRCKLDNFSCLQVTLTYENTF